MKKFEARGNPATPSRLRVFTAWGQEGSPIAGTLVGGEGPPAYCNGEIMPDCEKFFYRIDAATLEEAHAIHDLRRGYAPGAPMGDAAPCPDCGAKHYPHSSGQCWQCDHHC
jgi:hypothetical protein